MAKKRKNGAEEAPERTAPEAIGGAFEGEDFVDTRKPDFSFSVIGDQITGFYCGVRHIPVQSRVQSVHRFVLKNNDEIDVWGSKALDPRLSEIKVGSLIEVTFTHTEENNKGDHDTKLFNVRIGRQVLPEARIVEAQRTMQSTIPNGAMLGSAAPQWTGLPPR